MNTDCGGTKENAQDRSMCTWSSSYHMHQQEKQTQYVSKEEIIIYKKIKCN